MPTRKERNALIDSLYRSLQQERLASIRDDLADLGHPDARNITAHYELSEQYGWPVLTRLEADGTEVHGFIGSDAQDQLNALLMNGYDPDEGNTSLSFSFHDLPAEA